MTWVPQPNDRVRAKDGHQLRGTVVRVFNRYKTTTVRVSWDDGHNSTAAVSAIEPLDVVTALGDVEETWVPEVGERVRWCGPESCETANRRGGTVVTVRGREVFVVWDDGDGGVAYPVALRHLEPRDVIESLGDVVEDVE